MGVQNNNMPAISTEITGQSATSNKRMADLLVAYLEQLSVKYVFGIPGSSIEGLYDAMARSQRRGGVRPVLVRHETGAAFMADGYYRETGVLGVCCATTGPGATNLITGVASAYENHIPMLAITGQTSMAHFGKDAWQESSCTGVNTVGMFQFCTRYNTLVSHVDQFEHKLANAIMAAFRSPKGPVHLSIPRDILKSFAVVEAPQYDLTQLLKPFGLIDETSIDRLILEVKNARKIVLMLGLGCAGAIDLILKVAELLGARIVIESQGKGLLNAYHPLFRGAIGFAGHESAIVALIDPEVDVILAIGTSLGELASNAWDKVALLHDRLIHIDANEEHFANSLMAKLHVCGDIRSIFERLYRRLTEGEVTSKVYDFQPSLPFQLNDEKAYESDAMPIKPQRLMKELAALFPPETIFLADAGNSVVWSTHYLHPDTKRFSGNFHSCIEFGSMGWAVGASVGVALASPGKPVVCIVGDGSLLMSGQEFGVAVQERLPVIFVVLNDSVLGMVMHGQRLSGAESVSFDLPEVDFSAMARSMGAEAYIIRSVKDLLDLDVTALCHRAGPSLLDVRVDSKEVPPIGLKVRMSV